MRIFFATPALSVIEKLPCEKGSASSVLPLQAAESCNFLLFIRMFNQKDAHSPETGAWAVPPAEHRAGVDLFCYFFASRQKSKPRLFIQFCTTSKLKILYFLFYTQSQDWVRYNPIENKTPKPGFSGDKF